jgi:hypothetical protein
MIDKIIIAIKYMNDLIVEWSNLLSGCILKKRDKPKKKRFDPIDDIICCLYYLWNLFPK